MSGSSFSGHFILRHYLLSLKNISGRAFLAVLLLEVLSSMLADSTSLITTT